MTSAIVFSIFSRNRIGTQASSGMLFQQGGNFGGEKDPALPCHSVLFRGLFDGQEIMHPENSSP